jgi:hypothetical protein
MTANYSKGKIYSIRCIYDDSLIYVGSTIEPLSTRMAKHRFDSKKKICQNKKLYQKVYETTWDDFYIELYENFPCENRDQLNKREGEVIRQIGTLNKYVAGRTEKEYREENAEKIKENNKRYYKENAEKIKEYKKEYQKENAEKMKEYFKEYYVQNAGKIKECKKKYREQNAEKINEQIQCECGAIIIKRCLTQHKKTQKHINYINEKN